MLHGTRRTFITSDLINETIHILRPLSVMNKGNVLFVKVHYYMCTGIIFVVEHASRYEQLVYNGTHVSLNKSNR